MGAGPRGAGARHLAAAAGARGVRQLQLGADPARRPGGGLPSGDGQPPGMAPRPMAAAKGAQAKSRLNRGAGGITLYLIRDLVNSTCG
ncbi:hypothetical protein CN97_02355 [Haematobacter massiliensis]|uniref:Uncharacterized protein n=1 Tax=Haematobacter massiliensis TaxID=195105 RepID=A0A086XYA6_9RHOB|nr:hypothetical protein CN97_02355 [Haematobacter massiliensis]